MEGARLCGPGAKGALCPALSRVIAVPVPHILPWFRILMIQRGRNFQAKQFCLFIMKIFKFFLLHICEMFSITNIMKVIHFHYWKFRYLCESQTTKCAQPQMTAINILFGFFHSFFYAQVFVVIFVYVYNFIDFFLFQMENSHFIQ